MYLTLLLLTTTISVSSCTKLFAGQDQQVAANMQNFQKAVRASMRMFHNMFRCSNVNVMNMVKRPLNYVDDHTRNLFYQDILRYTPARLANRRLAYDVLYKWRCNVFIIDSFRSFKAASRVIESEKFRFYGYYLFILIDGYFDEAPEIFKVMFHKPILNAYILYHNHQEEAFLATYFPFNNSSKCGDTSLQVINSFRNGNFTSRLIPHAKVQNLNKCPVRMTTFESSIAVIKKTLDNGTYELYGYEIQLIELVAKLINFTLVIRFRDGPEEWGLVYDNGTTTKAFRELKDKSTDIIVGDYYLKSRGLKTFESSTSYLNYPIIFIVSPGSRLTVWEKFLRPFGLFVWILFVLTLALGISVILIINFKYKQLQTFVFGDGVRYPTLNLLIGIVGAQQNILPKKNFARFLLTMYLILCLVLRSIYQGSLFLFLQSDDRHKSVQHIEELVKFNYKIFMDESFNDIIATVPKLTQLTQHRTYNSLDYYMKMSDRVAVVGSKVTLIEYSLDNKKFPYKTCPENLLTINIGMYFVKDFFLTSVINEKIGMILSAGLVDHWVSQFDKRHYWKFTKIAPKKLTFMHLKGSFYVLIVGCFVAFVVFMSEVLVSDMISRRKAMKIIERGM